MTTRPQTPSGLVVVDKPAGWTSHDVVGRLRKIFGTRKVGHSGTLDPMATGVLVCGVGQGTRLMGFVSDSGKAYDATIRLGVGTTTDDVEGEVLATTPVELTDEFEAAIRADLATMVGETDQRPSSVSAIRVDGERAYEKVRRGEEVELPARRVRIDSIEIHEIRQAQLEGTFDRQPVVDLEVSVTCSSGTYVRAIARDLGIHLEVGGILTGLHRTRVGEFARTDSATLDALENDPILIPMEQALTKLFPTVTIDAENAGKFGNGGKVSPELLDPQVRAGLESGALLGVFADSGRALGVAEYSERAIAPKIVWPS